MKDRDGNVVGLIRPASRGAVTGAAVMRERPVERLDRLAVQHGVGPLQRQ